MQMPWSLNAPYGARCFLTREGWLPERHNEQS